MRILGKIALIFHVNFWLTVDCVFLIFRDYCSGSNMLCEYAIDSNDVFLDGNLKNITWPTCMRNDKGSRYVNTHFQRVQTLSKNMVIVRMKFKSPNVDTTVLDSRTTLSDKIANFGGTFGIWAELTGFSLLGILNIFVILIKVILKFVYKY